MPPRAKAPTQQELIEEHGATRLDDLYEIEDLDHRYAAIQAWIDAGEEYEATPDVKIGTSDGQKLTTDTFLRDKNGKRTRLVVTHSGKRMRRRQAVDLFESYGPQGKYRGVDQASGYAPTQWAIFKSGPKREVAEAMALSMKSLGHWPNAEPAFITNYLTHIVDEQAEDAPTEGGGQLEATGG